MTESRRLDSGFASEKKRADFFELASWSIAIPENILMSAEKPGRFHHRSQA
jgi:hypothetical protein